MKNMVPFLLGNCVSLLMAALLLGGEAAIKTAVILVVIWGFIAMFYWVIKRKKK